MLNLLSNAIKYTPRGGTVSMLIEVIEPPRNGMLKVPDAKTRSHNPRGHLGVIGSVFAYFLGHSQQRLAFYIYK